MLVTETSKPSSISRSCRQHIPSPTSIELTPRVTLMLVTDVGYDDQIQMLLTDFIHWKSHQHNSKRNQYKSHQYNEKVANLRILSPTFQICHHREAT